MFAQKARQHRYWLAAGMAVPHADGTLTNSGLVFGPDGQVRGRYDKSFLWHFDSRWFTGGRDFPVWDAGFAEFGVLICADGRVPEIARTLKVNGAEIILDLTAWVSSGRTMAELNTTQCEYLMPTRAFENSAWVAAADKWGTEDGTIVYAGRSCVIDPLGVSRASAPSTGDSVLVYDVEPMDVEPIQRRQALYGPLIQPSRPQPLDANVTGRVAVVPTSGGFVMASVVRRYVDLRSQGCDLAVFGGADGPEGWEVELPALEAAVRDHGGAAMVAVRTTGCNWWQSAALVTRDRTYSHTATHGRGIDTGESLSDVVNLPIGNVGMMLGDEGYVPEVARCLALKGADILAWPLFEDGPMAERVARTRSDESRVYTILAPPDGGVICNPDGGVIAAVPAGSGVAMTATTHLAFSRWKERAPGTDVFRDRIPEAYGPLLRR